MPQPPHFTDILGQAIAHSFNPDTGTPDKSMAIACLGKARIWSWFSYLASGTDDQLRANWLCTFYQCVAAQQAIAMWPCS